MCVIRTGKEGETGLIEIQNVSYAYEDAAAKALNNVSLTINDGEFVAVVGHNGSGKSTLAKHLNALLLPTEGKVLVDGMDTADEADTLSIRQRVGMVFQNPDNQLVTTIVEEDVAFGPENIGVPGNEIRTRVDRALAAVGMEKYAHSAPNMLSGGQKQRIAIAGMLAMQPKVLVLDEATAMLDPKGRRDIIDLVTKLHKENGITVVMITQYMEEAIGADRVAVMSGGELILEGTPKEVFSQDELLHKHRLDVPVMQQLANRLNARGANLPKSILSVEEMAQAICQSLSKN
jgi:energy-coupling factor transport system ATP-binding protein